MEVRHHEVGVVDLPVEGRHGGHDAGEPAQHEGGEDAHDPEERQAHLGPPRQSVPIQAKIMTAVGAATSVEAAEKKASALCGMPVASMWWTRSPKLSTASEAAAPATQP